MRAGFSFGLEDAREQSEQTRWVARSERDGTTQGWGNCVKPCKNLEEASVTFIDLLKIGSVPEVLFPQFCVLCVHGVLSSSTSVNLRIRSSGVA